MNRKQALKKLKEEKKNKNKNIETETNYVSRFVMTIGLLLAILVVGYLLIGIFINKTLFNSKEEEVQEVTIDNNTILAGQIFDQKEDSYYVLIYNKNDKNNTFIDNWKSNYTSKNENPLSIYIVDPTNSLNKSYIVDKDSNTNPSSYEDLKIVNPTLIKIENKEVKEYIEGRENIENAFKN